MDLCDNTSMMFTQVITIIDTTAPVWVTEAQSLDTTLSCSDIDGLDAAQLLVPEAMDNCGLDEQSIVKVSGEFVAGSDCPLWTCVIIRV